MRQRASARTTNIDNTGLSGRGPNKAHFRREGTIPELGLIHQYEFGAEVAGPSGKVYANHLLLNWGRRCLFTTHEVHRSQLENLIRSAIATDSNYA